MPILLSDTGPLVSAFQSNSINLIATLFGSIHSTETCVNELVHHGWEEILKQVEDMLIIHALTKPEKDDALAWARKISAHPGAKDRDPKSHLGEAEVIARRAEFKDAVILLDELAARAIASELGLTISGFAGVLLLAVEAGLLTPKELKERLERCRKLGTHYSKSFIESIFKLAQAGVK